MKGPEEIAARDGYVKACCDYEEAESRRSGYEILPVKSGSLDSRYLQFARPLLCWDRSAYTGDGGHCFDCHRHPPGLDTRCHCCGIKQEDA